VQIPVLSGVLRRFGKLGKVGLGLLIIGIVGGIILSAVSTPYSLSLERQVNGREVVSSDDLIGQSINMVQIRVLVEPQSSGRTYSIGIVPEFETRNVQTEGDLEEFAVAFWVGVEEPVELTYDQMSGAESFDIVIFSQQTLELQLDVSYNIAVGGLLRPVMLLSLLMMVLGFILELRNKSRFRSPFIDPYIPETSHETRQRGTQGFVDSGAEGEYAVERMVARSMPQTSDTAASEGDLSCPSCGGSISASDLFCPTCFIEL